MSSHGARVVLLVLSRFLALLPPSERCTYECVYLVLGVRAPVLARYIVNNRYVTRQTNQSRRNASRPVPKVDHRMSIIVLKS